MSEFILSCESTVDLSAEHLSARNIPYASFHYFIDEQEYKDDLFQSLSADDFYEKMAKGAATRTSQVNAAEYAELFEPFLKDGKDILHVTLSSGISGTYQSAVMAQEQLQEAYPERTIIIVDSLAASSGYGLFMDMLADKRDEGVSLQELAEYAENLKLHINHWFFSTDLTYYVRGGRISKASGWFGTLLNICPLLNVDAEGRLIPRQKCRGKKAVIRAQVEKMLENADGGNKYDGRCYISQSACPEDVEAVVALIEASFPKLKGKVEVNNIGPTIGAHTGPGTIALFFVGKERVD